MEKIINWIKNNWPLTLIIVVGAFLRLYRISEYMTFLGDEGRDAIIVRRLLVYGDPILIGPGTSIGGMYLGPLYYYLIAPSLFLANLSPVGPSVFIALIGILTIYFIYYVGKTWFSQRVGMIASLLYAVSPIAVIYSKSSWNPNVMPFFSLLAIYSVWKVWKEKKINWLFVTAISFAFVMQSHYLGLLLVPAIFICWFFSKVPLKHTLISLAIFGFLMSPLLIFDIRHNWLNTKALYKFFTVRQETVSIRPWNSIYKIYPIYNDMNTSLLTAKDKEIGKLVTFILVTSLAYTLIFRKKYSLTPEFYLLLTWLTFGLIGLGLYKQNIYDHYYGFLFPALFLMFAYFADKYINKSKLFYIFPIGLLFLNFKNSPINFPPNKQLQRSEAVAEKVKLESKGERFNLAVVAERNYEDGYQYFLEKDNLKIVEIDSQIKESITDQLFVVCEMPKEKCNPTNSPKAEVANFGWSKVDGEWEVYGVTIYRLIHTK